MSKGVYSTWNPSDAGSGFSFSNGNNTWSNSGGSRIVRGTKSRTIGKYYFEVTATTVAGWISIGIATSSASYTLLLGQDAYAWGYGSFNGYVSNSSTAPCIASTFTTGDVIGIAVDLTNRLLYLSKNGSWQCSGDPSAGTGGLTIAPSVEFFPAGGAYLVPGGSETLNTGATAFSYSVPSGFSAWH